jgi:four helix bundle protein
MSFISYDVSLELVATLRPLVPLIARHDRDLADQLRRAASSVVLNLGEGACSLGGNRSKHFWIAQGSASEVKAALHTAVAWGWVGHPGTALAVLDRLLALLWGLTHPKK